MSLCYPYPEALVFVYETSDLHRNVSGLGENRALRHRGGTLYAFADWHVKWFSLSQRWKLNFKPLLSP